MSLKDFINPSGGLYYHLQALKYKNSLWNPFRREIDDFLNSWQTKKKSLVIVGPSGGYTLSNSFLSNFETISLIDIDPLAPLFFKLIYPSSHITHDKTNYFENGLIGIQKLCDRYSESAILFSNILGQLIFLDTDISKVMSIQQSLLEVLKNRDWASYHDVVSFHFKENPTQICWPIVLNFNSGKNNFREIDYLKEYPSQAQKQNIEFKYVDHVIDKAFLKLIPQIRSLWKISPKSFHIIHGYHFLGE